MARIGTVTATAAAIVVLALWIGIGPGGSGTTFAATLEPVLLATDGAGAVHVVLRMLTGKGEDFSYVNLEGDLQTVEAWIERPLDLGHAGRARIDKSDRVYVFDGKETVYYHPQRNEVFSHEDRSFAPTPLWPAAWVRQIRNRSDDDVEVLLMEERGGSGRLLLREKGAEIAPLEPSFLGDFDRETEVIWDLENNLLTDFRRWVLVGGERILFSEVVTIDYVEAFDDRIFELDLPDGVREGGVVPGGVALLELGPREVALRFFESSLKGDRTDLELFCGSPSTLDWLLEDEFRPSEVLYLGEPFRAGGYPGVFVPYKVRFGTGGGSSVRTRNLALRNDNEQNRWIVDGGL